jgi:predicted Fe-Mo cluster-binding NifX family protein
MFCEIMMKKIAIPTREDMVDDHFGHCAYYTVVTLDDENQVQEKERLDSPEGCGCKSNIASVMQEKGIDVTAIDISPLSVETMKERGIKNVLEQDFFTLKGQFETILMLMNGIGIVGTLERLPKFFRQLDNILAPGGQVLCDSSDISYVFEDENGMIDIPNEMDYYGEHSFQMQYKDTIGEPFDWLYIDADTLKQKAGRFGYFVEVVAEGEHYDYLARITKMV